jgi:hypothetical protein
LFGLAFALATALGVLRRRLVATPRLSWAVTALCASALLLLHRADYRRMSEDGIPLAAEIRELTQQIPKVPGPILILNSPLEPASRWEAQYVLALKYRQEDLQVETKGWDQMLTPLKVRREEYQSVFRYDRFTHRYSNITEAAFAGIDRMYLSRASMGSSMAQLCIVNDVAGESDGKQRWAYQRPEFRFTAGPNGATMFFLDIQMPKVILSEAGPQRIQLFVNGEAGRGRVIEEFGDLRLVFDLPRELGPGEVARIRLEVANPWITPDKSGRLSFLVRTAGVAAGEADIEDLPSKASMGSPDAKACIVRDVDDFTDGKVRWARQRPEFRFKAGPGGATKFFIDFQMPEVILRDAGAQRIQVFLNGEAGGRQVIRKHGDLRVAFALPRALKPGVPARIRLEIANPRISKGDGARLSFLLREAGLE